jgi:RimJ/RimL family protein N-acetyltransferase
MVNDAVGVVGGISHFRQDGRDDVGYWVAKEHWGRGVASQGLAQFLREVSLRPLHATAVRANVASIRVLEKCGFRLTGHHMGEETDRYVAGEVSCFVLE